MTFQVWLKRVFKVVGGLLAGLVLLNVAVYLWPIVLSDTTYERLQTITASPQHVRLLAYRDINDHSDDAALRRRLVQAVGPDRPEADVSGCQRSGHIKQWLLALLRYCFSEASLKTANTPRSVGLCRRSASPR